MTEDQVHRLKQAKAAFEIIPMAIWSPYLLLMAPRCMFMNTAKKAVKTVIIGTLGAATCEVTSRYFRDKYYWPIVRDVYGEIYVAEQE